MVFTAPRYPAHCRGMVHTVTQTEARSTLNESLFDTIQTAAELKISKRTLQEQMSARKIGFIKFGRNVRFSRADIDRFIEAHHVLPVGWKSNASRGGTL